MPKKSFKMQICHTVSYLEVISGSCQTCSDTQETRKGLHDRVPSPTPSPDAPLSSHAPLQKPSLGQNPTSFLICIANAYSSFCRCLRMTSHPSELVAGFCLPRHPGYNSITYSAPTSTRHMDFSLPGQPCKTLSRSLPSPRVY